MLITIVLNIDEMFKNCAGNALPLLDYSFLVLNHGTVQQRKVACHCNELSHEI